MPSPVRPQPLVADVAFRARSLGIVEVPRLTAAALCVVVVAFAGEVAAPVALACVAAVCVGLVIAEAALRQAQPSR